MALTVSLFILSVEKNREVETPGKIATSLSDALILDNYSDFKGLFAPHNQPSKSDFEQLQKEITAGYGIKTYAWVGLQDGDMMLIDVGEVTQKRDFSGYYIKDIQILSKDLSDYFEHD
ncbi:hypothetical protein [Aquibacillus sediminis]|uniref:hypothetical protein n=1 Tax=Aquibacillus sediminis TaxID=2574734 RepID=UPI001109BAC4|nr:hypothetical protein [Aquibacillus sediminis]